MTLHPISLSHLNSLPCAAFTNQLATVYEHSPWIICQAAEWRPFPSIKALQATLEARLFGASRTQQIEVINAHPDLAAKLDQLETLTDFSQQEQNRAGFLSLGAALLAELRKRLGEYRETFGHPFILCISDHEASDVLPILEARSKMSPDSEHIASLAQIARIGWYRLQQIVNTEKSAP